MINLTLFFFNVYCKARVLWVFFNSPQTFEQRDFARLSLQTESKTRDVNVIALSVTRGTVLVTVSATLSQSDAAELLIACARYFISG